MDPALLRLFSILHQCSHCFISDHIDTLFHWAEQWNSRAFCERANISTIGHNACVGPRRCTVSWAAPATAVLSNSSLSTLTGFSETRLTFKDVSTLRSSEAAYRCSTFSFYYYTAHPCIHILCLERLSSPNTRNWRNLYMTTLALCVIWLIMLSLMMFWWAHKSYPWNMSKLI